MIITCNCGEKKFTLPDNSIPAAGRMVQCGFCGLKWKQFPVEIAQKKEVISKSASRQTITKPVNLKKSISRKKPASPKRKAAKKTREINLYSPEYLAKKHGIRIQDTESNDKISSSKKKKVSFGFYNTLLVFVVVLILISRILYFTQEIIKEKIPVSEFYLNYFFENIRNVFDIFKNLVTGF